MQRWFTYFWLNACFLMICSLKKNIASFLVLFTCISAPAQISHGGKPFALHEAMRSLTPGVSQQMFVDMPAFNVEQELRSSESSGDFKSLYFAHKFFVHLRPDNSGIRFTSYDHMNVWRVGIRSRGAYSINILFSKFQLPEGAKVFVYNSDQTEILGSYTSENNTDLNLLPVQPIGGDEIIVEYQEPENAEFKGEIEIGEVNHDFRGLFRAATEPRDPIQSCHPNLVCYPEDIQPGSGVVVLIINGNTYCTGSLINNTAENGTPYLITATHCMNRDYDPTFLANRKYDLVAGSIVAFFNYNAPVCGTDIRGNTQMTLASADSVLISERHDITLLKMKQVPPKEYQPYYLGWNVSQSPTAPFHGIHHPNGGIKKVAVDENSLAIASFLGDKYNMEPNAHWGVQGWEVGSTEGGSSGSPLLDKDKRILGTLTGGESKCSSPRGPDVYASLAKYWNVTGSLGNPNAINNYLDPTNSGFQQIDGFNPYASQPMTRINNFDVNEKPVQTYYNNTVPLFETNTTLGYTEFAEEFKATQSTQLAGVFVSTPAINNMANQDVRIRIYSGNEKPETLLHEQKYTYSFRYFSNNTFLSANRQMNYLTENYIQFPQPITVSGKFFIAYGEVNGTTPGFKVLNVEPRKIGSGLSSTTWMKLGTDWVASSENMHNPINTSLLLSPYIIGTGLGPQPPVSEDFNLNVYHNAEVDRIFIESNQELVSWEIFYVTGQKIHAERADKSINRASYSTAHLAKGVYIVKAVTVDGKGVRKVLVR